MNENKYIEVKEDLKSIIDAAFYEFDDYVTECHVSGVDVTEDVEDFVADAIIKAGYVVKLNATDINDGSKSGDCKNYNDHDDPVGEKGADGVDGIREMNKEKQIECCSCLFYKACLYNGEYTPTPCRLYEDKAGYRKQIEGKWVNNHCSICGMTPIGEETWTRHGKTPPRFELFMDYCPNCGAKMKGGERE